MLKYAFMSFSTPDLNLVDILETAHRYGYEGIEPRLDAGHAHGVEVDATALERNTIRREAEGRDIEIACLATSLSYADPAKVQEMIEQTHRRIDLAGDLAVPRMRIFGGKIPEGVERPRAVDQLVEALRATADHAGERAVTLCLETHDDWCHPQHLAAVLRRVDHPVVGANWDIMHPVRTAGVAVEDAYHTLRPWIRHLHVHDGTRGTPLRFVPIGTGGIDHRRAMELLLADDVDSYLSGEWMDWEPPEVHLPRELATLRMYEREISSAAASS